MDTRIVRRKPKPPIYWLIVALLFFLLGSLLVALAIIAPILFRN